MTAFVRSARAGFTLVEMALVAGLLAVTVWVGARTFASGRDAFRTSAQVMDIDTAGARAMRRVLEALRACDEGSIVSIPAAPFSSAAIDFQILEAYDGSSAPLGDPRRIEVEPTSRTIRWVENPGLASESGSFWSGNVAAMLEGELPNGLDDNGNALIDEAGLCFSREGRLIQVGLTMTTDGPSGPVTRTWTGRVYCRN